MEDWELFEAWCNGDNAAGQQLVQRYLGILTRFFRNKVRNPDDAAELISETLTACTKNRHNVDNPEAFRSFLFAAAMNILRQHFRKQAKRKRELDDFEEICVGDSDHPRSLNSMASLKEETRLLVRALRRLSLDAQIVLELEYFEGLGGTEIAELLGVPRQTIYTRLRRGKERIKAIMGELADTPELAQSTIMGLETWALNVRKELDRS
ncbi:MAG: RNA polymerase sigma factor [Myxococcota bacterium]